MKIKTFIYIFILVLGIMFIAGCAEDSIIIIKSGNSSGSVSGSNNTLIDASECLNPPCLTFLDVME